MALIGAVFFAVCSAESYTLILILIATHVKPHTHKTLLLGSKQTFIKFESPLKREITVEIQKRTYHSAVPIGIRIRKRIIYPVGVVNFTHGKVFIIIVVRTFTPTTIIDNIRRYNFFTVCSQFVDFVFRRFTGEPFNIRVVSSDCALLIYSRNCIYVFEIRIRYGIDVIAVYKRIEPITDTRHRKRNREGIAAVVKLSALINSI